MRTVSNTNIILQSGQRLSDVAVQLKRKAGVYFVHAKTGAGKTYHMTKQADGGNGVCIFPLKSVMAQSYYSLLDHIKARDPEAIQGDVRDYIDPQELAKRLHRHGHTTGQFVQIERIKRHDFSECQEIHVDEIQNLYEGGGYRPAMEDLRELIEEYRDRIPIYIYSATVIPELLPVSVDEWITIESDFNRSLNVIEVPTVGDVKGNTRDIIENVIGILRYEQKPLILFLNSSSKLDAMKGQLEDAGYSCIVCTSDEIAKAGTDAHRAYQGIINTSTLVGAGYDVVLTTKALAEGINLLDDIHVVSVQATAEEVFQQQGRVRNTGTHWLLCGDGDGQIAVSGGQVIGYRDGQRHTIRQDESMLASRCNWYDRQAADKCDAFALYSANSGKGAYTATVVHKLMRLGYMPRFDFQELLTPKVKTYHRVGKKALLAAIAEHGLPRSVDDDHPLINHLLSTLDRTQFATEIRNAIDWDFSWSAMESAGIKGDKWEVYQSINGDGRGWLLAISTAALIDEEGKNEDGKTIPEDSADYHKALARRRVTESVRDFKGLLDDIELTTDAVNALASDFWPEVMPRDTEWKWYQPSMDKTRGVLFRWLMGFTKSTNDHWVLKAERAAWDLPLTSAERKRLYARASHIEPATTIKDFCQHYDITNRDVANTKTKDVKSMVSAVNW